ncbi:MarR family winged helix-turn-helix transcriptional regulator [Micromonospora sp. WMMD737]|uniref:MarR family winged helix-turn-helix transcriptional regulator n=1 Tax=Micromonospora sp. WMMD737 TaxID=3404113 RepID=UPI003B953F2D
MALYVGSDTSSTLGGEDLVDGLSALSRTMVGITARTLATLDVEVTLSQYRTLVILAARGPLRTVDLAAALHVHPSTATRTCDRLIRRGLVARHHRPADRRVALLSLTSAGKTLVGDVMRHRTEEIRHLVQAVATSPQTTAELINSLVIAADEPTEEEWWHRWERCVVLPQVAPSKNVNGG